MRSGSAIFALTLAASLLTGSMGSVHAKDKEPKTQLDRSKGYQGYKPPDKKKSKKKGESSAPEMNYDPNQDTPEGYTDAEPYDPHYDPNHPLKDPTRDPGKEWERADKRNKADGSFGALAPSAPIDWDWRERYFNETFTVILNIKNYCKSEQPTSIFVTDVPGLSFPSNVVVPPGGAGLDVIGTVTLPSPPTPTGLPGEPPMGHVPLPPHFLPPGQPPFHQPNYVAIGGEVVTWHAEAMDIDGKICHAARFTYKPGGHIHWRPSGDEGDSGPSQLAQTDPCTLWWNIEERPPNAEEQECTPKIRTLAAHFMEKILAPFIDHAPADWAWLRKFGSAKDKSIAELLAMKGRASAVAEETRW